jgi:DNA gyrase subunit B
MARAVQQYTEANIKRLKFPENVRSKPGMYLGERGDSMVFQVLKEVIDNCVVGNTLVISSKGIKPIESFVDKSQTTGSKPYVVKLADASGISKSSHSGHYGLMETLKLKTFSGHTIIGSVDHPMLSYDKQTLTVDYKALSTIKAGDCVAVKLGVNLWASKPYENMTLNTARLLGYLVAEGYFGRMLSRKQVGFANKDKVVIADFLRCLKDFPEVSVKRRVDSGGCIHLAVKGVEFIERLHSLGVTSTWRSHSVRIPTSVLQSPKEYVVEFLKAYYEGDGSAIKGRIEAGTKSAKLVTELQVVLGNLGIFTKVQKSMQNGEPFYQVWVTKHKHRFLKEVGFITDRKNDAVTQYSVEEYNIPGITQHINDLIETTRSGNKKSAWYITESGAKKRLRLTNKTTSGENRYEVTKTKLLQDSILENICEVDSSLGNKIKAILAYDDVVWVEVRSVSVGKKRQVFDFKVPATRSFVANGLISSNCYDEFTAGRNKFISVFADNKTNTFIVADKAQGIPVGLVPSDPENPRSKKVSTLTLIFTELHTGGKFDDKAYKTSKGTHGVGAAASNAVCASFEVWSHRDRAWYYQQFKQGKPVAELKKITKLPVALTSVLNYKPMCGSIVRLSPDLAIVSQDGGKTRPKLNLMFTADWLKSLAQLNAGLEVTFSANGKSRTFLNTKGLPQIIADQLAEVEADPLGRPFIYDSPTLSVALQWSSYPEDDALRAYVESGMTRDGGEHEVGLRNALNKALTPYKKKTDKFAPKDIYYGMLGIINWRMSGAEYSGQTKDRLTSNVAPAIEQELLPELTRFFTKYKTTARLIIRRALDVKKSKDEFKKTLDAVASAKRKSKNMLPAGLVQANKASHLTREVFIVEGDSAGGSSKKARDPRTQEVLKLTGKIANSAKMKLHKLMESKAIQDILVTIGYNFNTHKQEGVEHKLRVNKIFLLPDADVDGQHITVLLLTLLNKLMPELFEQGRVYIVDAPLFSAYYKNTRYLGETLAEVQGKLPKGAKVQIMRSKGWGEISYETLSVVAFNPATRTVIQVKPVKGKELQYFNALVGNDSLARKELLGL